VRRVTLALSAARACQSARQQPTLEASGPALARRERGSDSLTPDRADALNQLGIWWA
jgi:hypothetical protein